MKFIKIVFLCLLSISLNAQEFNSPIRYLALGDSYTIGQSVSYNERWPTILKDSLTNRGFSVDTLAYIATTGWRTDNLISAINRKETDSNYNLVSLLIGVNNQFQGKEFSLYKTEFPNLLNRAITLAQNNKNQVFVVSIPDYAFTPYGGNKYRQGISDELDEYNNFARRICDSMDIPFYNITPISRSGEAGYVASDGLHPSGKQYNDWVNHILTNRTLLKAFETSSKNNKLYPNPSKDFITLPFFKNIQTITFYNNTGTIAKKMKVKSDTIQHGLKEGTYSVSIKLKNNEVLRTKLIIQ